MIWPKRFSYKALTFVFVVLFLHIALFPSYVIPWALLLFGTIAFLWFFLGMNYFTRKWQALSSKAFVRSLLISSFFIKIIFLIATMLLILIVDPKSFPFEIGGGQDSVYYHQAGSDVAVTLFKTDFTRVLKYWYKEKGDYGYPTYVGFIYYLFGKNLFAVKFISILFSMFTVLFIYKLARNTFNEEIGRFAGIMAMLIPVVLWFDTMSVKESIMTFIIFLCLYVESDIIRSKKLNLLKIFIVIACIYLLFYFRMVLVGLLSVITVVFFLLNLGNRKISRATVIVTFLIILIILSTVITETESLNEFKLLVAKSQTQLEDDMFYSAINRGVRYQKGLVVPFILVGAIVTPFPSLFYFKTDQLTMVSHFFNELIRNGLYFFVFIGIWICYKKHFKESSLILMFTLGYIFILAAAGKSFQDRFQFPAFPGMLILISVGFAEGKKYFKYWTPYLYAIGAAVLVWNLFKLSIRGLL